MRDNGPSKRVSEPNIEDLKKASILKMSSENTPKFVLTNVDAHVSLKNIEQ